MDAASAEFSKRFDNFNWSIYMRRGIMALEELEEGGEVAQAEVTDFVEAPENDLADAAVAEGEVAAIDDSVEEAADTAETLEAVHDEMGKSLEEGGMSEPEARALEVAVEHLCARVGFPKSRKTFPAMEGFANKTSRIQATKIAMEEVAERAKKLWDTIIAALKRAWEWVKNFFKSLLDATIGLKARAEKLEKVAAATKGGHGPTGKKINSSGFALLTVDGKLQEHEALVSAYAKHTSDAFITADRAGLVAKLKPHIEKSMDAIAAKDEDALVTIAEDMLELTGPTLGTPGTAPQGVSVPEGGQAYVHSLVFGGATYVAIAGESKGITKVQIVYGDKATVPEQVEACETSTAGKLAGAVAKHMDTFKNSPTKIGEAINSMNSMVAGLRNQALANKTTKAIKEGKSPGEAMGDKSKIVASSVRGLNCAVTQASAVLKGYDVKIAKAVLDYAGASLSGLKQEKAAAPAKEAAALSLN